MTCERCDGLMVSEQICDLQGMSSDLQADGCLWILRCHACRTQYHLDHRSVPVYG